MELERSAVFGSQCSPISDDRWHERDERANIQSHASASFPPHLLCSFLPPHLGCCISFLSHEWMWGGVCQYRVYTQNTDATTYRHISHLFFPSSLPSAYFFPHFPLFFPSSFSGTVHITGAENNPHNFGWVNTLRALGFWDSEFFYATLWWWSPGYDGWLNGLRNFTLCSKDTHHLSSKLPPIIH